MSNNTDQATLGAATFIRDLYYNPKLRDSYFLALNTQPQRKKAAVNNILLPYKCTIDNLGAGWATLENQSFLAWQSVYKLKPINEGPNTVIHTCTLVGSRTGKTTVLFDDVLVIGFKTSFPTADDDATKLPTISWEIASSNCAFNVSLELDHNIPTDGTGEEGDRIMRAKIWADNETQPTDFTHSGLDFFSDMGMFNGKYNTLTTDVDSGDQDSGLPASVTVNYSVPNDATTATVDLNITAKGNNVLSVAKGLASDRDSVQWDGTNNASTVWPDAVSAGWKQGYLTFSWEYIPPKPNTGSGGVDAVLKPKFSGSIWLDDMNNSVQIDGDIQPDSISEDISNTVAVVIGAIASGGLFILIGVGIYKAIKKLIKWAKDKFAVESKEDKGETPTEKELVDEKNSDQVLEKADDIAQLSKGAQVVDPNDASTLERQLKENGEETMSYRGELVYKNPRDPNTSLADLHVSGEASVGKEVVENDGSPIGDLDSIPTLKSPIDYINTGEKIMVKEIGKQFTHLIIESGFDAQRALTGEGEDVINFEPEKIRI